MYRRGKPGVQRAAGSLHLALVVALVTVSGMAFTAALAGPLQQPESVHLPHVLVVATGGTIASRASSPEQLSGYRVADTGEDLVTAVPAIADVAKVTVEQYSNVGSTSLTPADWLKIAQLINKALEGAGGHDEFGDVDGVVVTHGTDALEETAFFLNLTVRSRKPVVVVGAMRPASAISADGPLNLLNAIRVAAEPASRERGVMVILNQEINAARDVTKNNTKLVQTFVSRSLGLLGIVDNDQVLFYRRSERRHTYQSEIDVAELTPDDLPRVDISYTYGGSDGADVDAFVAKGARGIVVATAGAGATTRGQGQALRRAAEQGVLVVRSSRTGSGRVGGGRGRGRTVGADDLNPQKARILLMLALTVTDDPAEIQRFFDTY
ncbi:MAG: asparaginase [Acidobacteriota bacterium]